ncbi:MAG: glutathione peroxidase [Bacteroidales bacterium]|nr:glutathione peroxidase [Bacteroidales bacterium]
MKNTFFATFIALLLLSVSVSAQNKKSDIKPIYQFKVKDITGQNFDFKELEGKKIMIVNTASKCGFTKQFTELQEIYETYKDQNFVIVGFPSNDFMNQDPGSNEEILEFCTTNFGVSFPMMSKIQVTGKKKANIYKYLTDKDLNGYESSKVNWNFQKYLINDKGYLEKVIGTKTAPDDDVIINWIEKE